MADLFVVFVDRWGDLFTAFLDRWRAMSDLFTVFSRQMSLTGYTVIVMAVFWVTDAVPVAVASLIPVAVLPVFGIMSTDAVSRSYMSATSMMFVGGLMVALAVEYCDLHRRLALRVLLAVGTSPRMIMLGFMSITCLLSMWISNTAATAMMVPIAQAVLDELLHEDREDTAAPISGKKKKIRVGVMMSLAYASNIGGTGTLVGSGTQLVLKGILQRCQLNITKFIKFKD